ncbi:uncharacterized protein LOC128297363 isoform X2 [Anopheles moucheti]|uniref:uncharacterized protein LOC128297363 isoform X2 n=1 Tax=Anopheles moucheti TaxID=186751 RepID=UPI0022EFFAA2|nr:uncharacterized protein LOC128297363 isoform X2 [Anopheles moucheti]
MSSWAQRMHRRAATFGSVVTSCGHPGTPYPNRLEKVKFGVPLEDVCKNDIPGPLLVLILKLNKEAPCRKDVFRAPGNQGAMKKLIHFLQQGRLVNVDNYSVYTIASVLKKFLRKIPGGVFGRDGEAELFQIVDLDDEVQQQEKIHRLLMSLPGHTQRLLVLLFGTFRVIASNSERAETGMTSEALGVSVAPSFFQSCVSDGKTARMKDVLRFKVATKIMKQMIEQFTACDLFGRVNYEYYARVTGRVLRVQDEWICSFRYPPPPRGKTAQQHYALKLALETEKTWLQCECERWGLMGNVGLSASAESVHQSSAKRPSRRGGSRHGHLHRSSSRRNKENGSSRSNSFRNKANGSKGGANSNTTASNNNNHGTNDTIINNSLVVVQTVINNSAAGGSVPMVPSGTIVVAGSGRVRKQRAVSFEQTSTTTAGTMTTSSSVSGGAASGMTCPVTGCSLNHQTGGVAPRSGVVWHEYASKSLDEKKLLTKQHNVGDGTVGDGAGDGSVGGRRSIVSVCVNDRQLLDSDDDWPMVDQSQAQPLHHHQHPHSHHHHHSPASVGGNAGTPATGTTTSGSAMSTLLHHFKPPRI